ncbi:hypothetical protein NE619_17345 [Anaerovorax odorimutans]|uniref:Uncharacterized protein n=1 Tax=Anaerovorax odorimutans TaxID=109327 RepID=A0ABT1RTF5_9FIRM|nr:hypothetical protein [Anaerovorax odorimutans]MCQ4638497.1 hypothetical protein [Anaerovorax odorimutans]
MKAITSEKKIFVTPNIQDDEEAIALKMKQIHPKLLGLFCPVKYELIAKEKVQLPYEFLVFHYKLVRSTKKQDLNKQGIFDREGDVAVVFDMNEVHAFHFDLFDDLNLQAKDVSALQGRIIKANCSEKEVLEQSIECIKWQYLRKVFHAIPQLTLIQRKRFYREAWRLELMCRGKQYEKFAYRDRFGAENEHISGLRVRLTT